MFDAMRDIGFVILTNHGLPERPRSARAEAASFFALPDEAKKRCACLPRPTRLPRRHRGEGRLLRFARDDQHR